MSMDINLINRTMSMGINLTNTTHVNEYKLDKYDLNQRVIVVDKMIIVNGLE